MNINDQNIKQVKLPDIEEKRLIIARYFINQKNADKEFHEWDIYYMWNNYFPSDYKIPCAGKLKLREKEGNIELVALENRENLPEGLIESYNLRWRKTYIYGF